MSQDWLADVRKYDAGADENIVAGIVRYCGIALRSENASKVSFDEKDETDRVREKFLKKKLALTQDDATLDGAIQSVGAAMGGGDRNRVSVYYLLTKHFGLLEMFNKPPKGAKKTAKKAPSPAPTPAPTAPVAAASAAAAGTTAATTNAASAAPAANDTIIAAAASSTGGGGGAGRAATARTGGDDYEGDEGIWGIAALAGAVMFGAILFAAIIGVWVKNTALTPDEVEEPAAAAAPAEPEPATAPEAAEPEVPDGAGVTASERDGRPMLTVYFDSGSSAVAPDFSDTSSDLVAYLNDNPDAKVTISGYNDPTGNAEINARLSKERAENVQAALVAGGVAEDRTELVKPDDTTTTDMTAAEARRVEIVISD